MIAPSTLKPGDMLRLKNHLISLINRSLEGQAFLEADRQRIVSQSLEKAFQSLNLHVPDAIREQVFHDVLDELLGYGVLTELLNDPEVSEIMVNGPEKIYIERRGKITKTTINLENNDQVLRLIDRIILPLGRRIDSDSPTVDARLPDGSRVNAVIPPVAIDGPTITIRKFQKDKLSIQQLIDYGSLTPFMAEFLQGCVVAKLNIIISGGTGSGKTTLLNALSSYIPTDERVVTIEDAAELKLQQDHVVRLESKPANSEGKNAVTIRDLVRNALRMRPDRIVIGEVRGGEALDMLQAMNTGHDGSLTTLHANSPRDSISRLETMCMMAGMELPLKVIREQIASAIDLVVVQARLRDGTRRITNITEVSGMEGDTVTMSDIFKFAQTGVSKDGKVIGDMKPTGIRPLFFSRLEAAGLHLGPEIFGANIGEMVNRRQH
ncbi:MAG TPA: CpaF family protein [Longilinea sp.]|nr:CpaF family protein [Longilinea sp.]